MVKVTTERLPKSLLALDIELDRDQVERGLDRAARQFARKYTIPGFRKGKAPRFIIENYFGREALFEEASEDLINRAYAEALKQEQIEPVGPGNLEKIASADPFTFRITVPLSPTVTLPDYRAMRMPLDIQPVTDADEQYAMDMIRDRHVALQELEEPRPAQQGDQLVVKMRSLVDGQPLEAEADNEELEDATLVLEPNRLVDELYHGLQGANVGEEREIQAQMPDDHANEQIRGKQITFKIQQVVSIQARVLPDWEEIPGLEEFEGTLDELRAKTRADLEKAARDTAERALIDAYITQLAEQTEYDIPDVMIQNMAENMLQEQEQQLQRYGITMEQMLQYRGQTQEQAIADLLPEGERQLKRTLALQEVSRRERLELAEEDTEAEIQNLLKDYAEEERERAKQMMEDQLRQIVANAVMDRKLRERIVAIATGTAPELDAEAADSASDDDGEPETVENAAPEPSSVDHAQPADETAPVSSAAQTSDSDSH